MKRCILFFILFYISFYSWAQLKSPEQFLGYKIGTRYTPHWKIVDYFQYVAATAPGMVKLQEYGQTYEGRPLIVAYVSSSENISRLEAIRNNNLKLAGFEGTDKGSVTEPVVVWLSYNVHGNEASSSEASMLTIYALADPSNQQTKTWLKNTVVIIDPCLNPDGRDRYVNWYTSVAGKNYNPALDAREHKEPWPGGRTNHYNFDLNRDWAWQTQIETRQRMKVYNDWLPEVHVDFHEQNVNSPYYFAPAAQPYHEVITPWQRDFQNIIGRNHAKYFDEKGWLYFTKEVFDLLYPSYGDTYPIYNGSIGMTYEQAGGPSGGLGALTKDGDTLTLTDRAIHHFTTGMSTIEVASKNAGKLMTEYQNFFQNAATKGIGNYKSYIIKSSTQDEQRIGALLDLLRRNKINFGVGKPANIRGYNYDNGREENVSVTSSDIIIPSNQPKGGLVKVLFEPNTVVVDSVTYDITAWSLPYVFGIKAYATRQSLTAGAEPSEALVQNGPAEPYGYVFNWNGMKSAQFVSQLLQKGIRLRYTEQPFETAGKIFDRGTIIVLKTSNQYFSNLWSVVRNLADKYKVQLTPVTTGFVEKGSDFGSSKVHGIKRRKLAMLTGDGINANAAGEIWHFFEQELDYPITLINQADFSITNWNDYDVMILPNGNYRFLSDKSQTEQLKSWIAKGGHLIALENAVAQLTRMEGTIKLKKAADTADEKESYQQLKKFENRERDIIPSMTPGSIFKVELDNTHPLAFGYPAYYYTLKQDDNIFEFMKDGWNVGVLKKNKQVAGFVGSQLKNRLQDGMLFGVQEIGNGTITYLADDVLFRNFWEGGKLMFCNALFLVGQ
ncbi:M14 family metallopeptidase [Chitinophagaceae bacterium LB-8]|uniref:M14 family metallopeptidase n=1 Tax=Paraflavisolibacter caeni TaxID=2982496 RepID=A0A9X2Y130_9BACT|nr:M14 family metallopeptidase [Paraflavisolibacter caeni]MCU7552512.1 M14 family metallopeptidase [Paraflavisolibacter caeni]